MTYAPYPAYKPSGVAWLGDVPKSWYIKRARFLFTTEKGKATRPESSVDEGAPLISMDYLRDGTVTELVEMRSQDILAKDGDLLILWDGSNAGEFLISKYGIVSATIAKLNIDRLWHKKYAFYLLKSAENILKVNNIGMGIPHVNGFALKELSVLVPSLEEQQAIAAFLDAKTAEIDALIAKKEALLTLLAEQRTALITQAVTKGLNPDAPTKPSGIDWLGDIPLGWEVRKLTHSLKYQVGFTPESGNEHYYGEGYNWANISDLKQKFLVSTEKQITQEAVDKYRKPPAPKGSLLYSFKLSVGLVSIADSNVYTNEAIAAFLPGKYYDLRYLYYLAPLGIIHYASENIYGAKILNQEAIGGVKLPTPSIPEQQAIAAFLDAKTAEIDGIKTQIIEAIKILKEYRTALITNAVTGKVDVRQQKGSAA